MAALTGHRIGVGTAGTAIRAFTTHGGHPGMAAMAMAVITTGFTMGTTQGHMAVVQSTMYALFPTARVLLSTGIPAACVLPADEQAAA